MKRNFSRLPVPAALLLVLSLTLSAGLDSASAAPKSKAAPAAEAPAPPPPPAPAKKSFLKRINPFAKDQPAPPAAAPAAAPKSAAGKTKGPAKNSTKAPAAPAAAPAAKPAPAAAPEAAGEKPGLMSRLKPGFLKRDKNAPRADAAPAPATQSPPNRSLANAKTREPGPLPPAPVPAPSAAEEVIPAPKETEKTEKKGFFARLKNHLTEPVEDDSRAAATRDKPEKPADWKERWVVKEDQAAFYEFGPSQPSGPDERLRRGAVVKLVQGGRGWARVELEGGRTGYLGTDQLRQAGENDFAEPTASPSPAQLAGVAQPDAWRPLPPPPDLPDLPLSEGMDGALLLLPSLDGPAPKRTPGAEPPLLQPGDAVPIPVPVPDNTETPAAPEAPAPEPPAPAAPEPAPAPAPEAEPTTPSKPEPEPAAPAVEESPEKPAAAPAEEPTPAPAAEEPKQP